MNKCKCKRFLWIKKECKSCRDARIKSNQEWERKHTFIYGEKVLIDDDFIGNNIEGEVVNRRIETTHYPEICDFHTSIYYSIKLPDGNIVERSRYNIKKLPV